MDQTHSSYPHPPPQPGGELREISPDQIDADALKILQRLKRHGFEAYLVGGCVRDLLIGRQPKDFDIATAARPRQIKRLFRNSRIIGRRFKLVHVTFGDKIIEVSTFRGTPEGTPRTTS
jgi:poly(A) polymerase